MTAEATAGSRRRSRGAASFLDGELGRILDAMIRADEPRFNFSGIARRFREETGREISLPTVRARATKLGKASSYHLDGPTRGQIEAAIREDPWRTIAEVAAMVRTSDGRPVPRVSVRAAMTRAGIQPPPPRKPPMTAEESALLDGLLMDPDRSTIAATAARFRELASRPISKRALRERAGQLGREFRAKQFSRSERRTLDGLILKAGPGETARKIAAKFARKTGRTVSQTAIQVRRSALGSVYIKLDGRRYNQ